jgi:RNA polymerase sigma-70 factor (ECF subfamily)
MSRTPVQEALFKAWLEVHRGIVVKIARSFAPTPIDAADLQQEMLLQLWLSTKSYSGQAQASTWIYKVCLNTALMFHRGTARRERRVEPGLDFNLFAADVASPAESAVERETLDKLYAAIQSVPNSERALILLMLDGLSYREISEVTGLTENHVGVALSRARKHLAEHMKGVIDELE